jgi:hypothetical protein
MRETTDKAKKALKCPACNATVQIGDITCHNCGVNLKSGESYESQIKRARGKQRHREHFVGSVMLGTVLAFALIIFAGFMHQRGTEKLMARNPEYLHNYVGKSMVFEELLGAADKAEAQRVLERNKSAFEFQARTGRIVDDAYGKALANLAAATDVRQFARQFVDGLIEEITDMHDSLTDEEPYEAGSGFGSPRVPNRPVSRGKVDYSTKAYKLLLRNLRAKLMARREEEFGKE